MRTVERFEDMSPRGKLKLIEQPDGDIIVVAVPDPHEAERRSLPPLGITAEFCTVGGGGGQSKHTRDALRALFLAMERDNEERPQNRGQLTDQP